MATKQYARIPDNEIETTAKHDPTRALLMIGANSALKEAEQQAGGQKPHKPKFHECDWSIAIETPWGVVGLWSCWLGDRFYIGYPKSATGVIEDELIINTLGVELASEVLQVSATAVNDPNYTDEYKDADKPLEQNGAGQIVAYKTHGLRRWAKFYGPRQADDKGRVWVDHGGFCSNSHDFSVVSDHLVNVRYGHDSSMSIETFSFNFWNQYAPDGPTTDRAAVQAYRDRFLQLAIEIANLIGGATAVNIDYQFVLVPEQLDSLGYQNITWLGGRAGVREGWGSELVRAEKGDETIILKSANSMVPWINVRRVPCPNDLTVEKLIELLTF